MHENPEASPKPLSSADLARVLSPLLLFVLHVVYLAVWSPEPFLNKWIDGCFSFFVSLVLCNVVRARVAAAHAASHGGEAAGEDHQQ